MDFFGNERNVSLGFDTFDRGSLSKSVLDNFSFCTDELIGAKGFDSKIKCHKISRKQFKNSFKKVTVC